MSEDLDRFYCHKCQTGIGFEGHDISQHRYCSSCAVDVLKSQLMKAETDLKAANGRATHFQQRTEKLTEENMKLWRRNEELYDELLEEEKRWHDLTLVAGPKLRRKQ